MAQDINKALEILEKNLKDLESARTQVEKTIKTSTDLQQTVSEYVAAVKALVVSLEQMGSDWDNRGKTILDDFEKRLEELSNQFSDKTNEEISRFKDQNDVLSTTTEKLATISSELSEVKQSLEGKLDELCIETRALKEDVEGQSLCIQKSIDSCQDTLQNSMNSIDGKTDALRVETRAVKEAVTEHSECIQRDIASCQDAITSSLNSIDGKADNLLAGEELSKKNSRINLIAIIIGVIILVILHFV